MNSDDKMLAILGASVMAMFAIGMIAAAWVGVERTRTERVAIERGGWTPAMSPTESHEE